MYSEAVEENGKEVRIEDEKSEDRTGQYWIGQDEKGIDRMKARKR